MITVSAALDEFFVAMRADGLKDKTIAWYQWSLSVLVERFGAQPLDQITTKDLRHYILSLKDRPNRKNGRVASLHEKLSLDSINGHVRCLHRFWSWCAAEYGIHNPMSSIKYPRKPEPKPKPIRLDDLKAIFTAAGRSRSPARDRALIAFLIDTGCRAGGVVGLRLNDLDLELHRAIVDEKGGKTRAVYFTSWTRHLLEVWIEQIPKGCTHVFFNIETLQPLTVSGLRLLLKRLGQRAGVNGRVNPHSFRHAFAREYLAAGGDLSRLSKLMGHRDVTTTVRHYAIYNREEARLSHEQYSPARKLEKATSDSEKESPA